MRIKTTAKNLKEAMTAEWNKTHKEDEPEVIIENMQGETVNMKDITIEFITLPEITVDEYAEQIREARNE